MKIDWLIPDPLHGSGGYRTILEHVRNLESLGHECVLHVQSRTGSDGRSKEDFRKEIERSFFPLQARIEGGWATLETCDVIIATHWMSAPYVKHVAIDARKIYFTQDFEPWFYPMGERYLLAENTYRLGLHHLTNSRFLQNLLKSKYNAKADVFDFSADPIYSMGPILRRTQEPSVAFLFQPEKPHRCPWIGAQAMQILKSKMPEVTIYVYGSTQGLTASVGTSFPHVHLGVLEQDLCAQLYQTSHVGVCLSATNPSRIPFEMMASGCAVVDLALDNNRYDYDTAVSLVEPIAEKIADRVYDLLRSDSWRHGQVRSGLRLAEERTAARAFEQASAVILGK